ASRALRLREGKAPVRDRLFVMLFLAALAHGLIILGLTFNSSLGDKGGAPGLEVLLVSDEVPEADRNDSATYLAQRTQLGSGNTQEAVAPRNRASSVPIPQQDGVTDGNALAPKGDVAGMDEERVLTTTGWSSHVQYLADEGSTGHSNDRPLLLDQEVSQQPGPEDDQGPAELRGPKRDELWTTPDTKAAELAPYLDSWRRKVEHIGTIHFPAAARSAGPKSNPVIEVGILADGSLDKAEIRRSSGSDELDNAALQTLKLAAPFDPFPPDLARQHRVLRFVYEWQWTRRGGVTAIP
ncbi:MAG TPA: TonB family protein, partial [Steroidobacteraceae bacterium]|nr:TonB family protein [Steroidobacteraceae bacterium]